MIANPKPNPGSPEAIKIGCTCPPMDNHHGAGVPHTHGPAFWIDSLCPVHSKPSRPGAT